jgi:hypothetical protein
MDHGALPPLAQIDNSADLLCNGDVQDPLEHSECEDYDPDDTASNKEGSVSSPAAMLKLVCHCELDAHFQMAIVAKVQILPLMKQLTNLAGNAWYDLIF